ncbi:MAG: GNAT family N-acetyltransferase [Verrucomicrobiota bacterium]|nr:GNAT family N-acetyltransferase [Verrucomicrobiota bacterium]
MNEFIIRRATVADAATIASHRARMFRDMGQVPPELYEPLRASAEKWLVNGFGSGEYVGWLATAVNLPLDIIGGVGVQLRRVSPHARQKADGEVLIAEGRHALVINVFTEPKWRRRGIGESLVREIIAWAKTERLDRLVLHASKEGRKLYERLGFVITNEMRYAGDLGEAG